MEKNGVNISIKEMFSMLQEVLKTTQRLESKLESVQGADERSREALFIAQSARQVSEETKNHVTWLWRTTLAALISGGIGALFIFFQ
jgi:hypothetical protein